MEAIKLEGIVYQLGETKELGEKKFKVRELILEVEPNSQYPQYLSIQGTGDKCGKMDDLVKGSEVTLHVNLQGRLYKDKDGNEKSFNSLGLWKFDLNKSVPVSSVQVEDEDKPPF